MARILIVVIRFFVGGALGLLWSHPLWAQDGQQDHSCTVNVAFLETVPVGKDGRNFDSHGWGFEAGGGFAVTPPPSPSGHAPQWFVTGNYLFTKLNATNAALNAAITSEPQLMGATAAHGSFSAVTLDASPRVRLTRHTGVYWVAGFGWLRRGIEFNGPNNNTLLEASNPTLGSSVSNSGVFDAAMGFTVSPALTKGMSVFVEARVYHGLAINSSTTLVSPSVGIRW